MSSLPRKLLGTPKLYLFDFDGVITTESEDVALKAQTLSVFAAISRRFDERALKMIRLVGQAVYKAGGTFSLGPLVYEAAHLLKPASAPVQPTLAELIHACSSNLDYSGLSPAPPIVHQGFELLKGRGATIGVYSNGVRENALSILGVKGMQDIFPVEHVFDAISTCDDHGRLHPKPAAEGFRRVLKELQVKPKDCVFVDNSRKNVRAAKKDVGCSAVVYIGPKLKSKDEGVIDHVAPSLEGFMGDLVAAAGE